MFPITGELTTYLASATQNTETESTISVYLK